jgi:hypothetical protein
MVTLDTFCVFLTAWILSQIGSQEPATNSFDREKLVSRRNLISPTDRRMPVRIFAQECRFAQENRRYWFRNRWLDL